MAFKDLFDPTCRAQWFRLWSNQLAIAFGILMVVLVEQQVQIVALLQTIQSPLRELLVFFVTGVVPIIVRIMHQPGLPSPPADSPPKP